MDVAALILACAAVVLFVVRPVNLGLICLTAALICQYVQLTGHLVTVN